MAHDLQYDHFSWRWKIWNSACDQFKTAAISPLCAIIEVDFSFISPIFYVMVSWAELEFNGFFLK